MVGEPIAVGQKVLDALIRPRGDGFDHRVQRLTVGRRSGEVQAIKLKEHAEQLMSSVL